MSKKILLVSSILITLVQIFSVPQISAQTITSRNFGERFVIQAVRSIHGAEMTYQATVGNGIFGSLENLRQADFIDPVLASGEKYGYVFALSATPPTAAAPAKFTLTATPRQYRKSGRFSYFVNETGQIRGADKNGGPANATDPIIDACSLYGDIAGNERCTIFAMRSLFGAQETYRMTAGNGSFGNLADLYNAGLIPQGLAGGQSYGYNFVANHGFNGQLFFYFQAEPQSYGVTGRRSFYIGMDGVVRSADRQGQPAGPNDSPVND